MYFVARGYSDDLIASFLKNTDPLFVPEKLYHRRRDIHARFGGQEQGGMMTPAKHSLILLVTGNSGRQHGYEDRWDGDGSTFFYFGEGQLEDMKFIKANLALRDHSQTEKMCTYSKKSPTSEAIFDIRAKWSA